MLKFACCTRSAAPGQRPDAAAILDPSKPASAVHPGSTRHGGENGYDPGDPERAGGARQPVGAGDLSSSNESNRPRSRTGTVAYGVVVVYALIISVVAVRTFKTVGPAGDLGVRAFASLKHVADDFAIRDWAGEKAELTATYLKEQISEIEFQFPGRLESMHQDVPLNQENINGPTGAEECMAVIKDSCIESGQGDCKRCPFDETTPQGPRCCGQMPTDGQAPLPLFTPCSNRLGIEADLAQHGGSTVFRNIVFRVKGSGDFTDGSAILVSAHYDSAFSKDTNHTVGEDPTLPSKYGPGVSDDLAGVAVLLEAARRLASEQPLPRDVIFAFVSGEEAGLMGSVLFRQLHEWRSKPAVLLNLKGRGAANGKEWLVRANSAYAASAYARFAARPSGFSFSEWIFQKLNTQTTDFDVYRRLGIHGMDLVYVQDSFIYNTPDDSIEHASAEGLEHEGSNVLSLLRGIAADSSFPKLLCSIDDPVVGQWNNDFEKDDEMTSRTFYVSMFDSSLWSLPIGRAAFLFITFSLLSPIIAVIAVFIRWMYCPPEGGPALSRTLVSGLIEIVFCTVGVLFGTVVGAVIDMAIVSWRDLRTWYDFDLVRMFFLGLSGVAPIILLDGVRRRQKSPLRRFCPCFRIVDDITDHSSLLGVIGANALFLFGAAVNMPSLGFPFFWLAVFAPLGLLAESLIHMFLPAQLSFGRGTVGFTALLPGSAAAAGGGFIVELAATILRDALAVFLPSLLQVPQVFNFSAVSTFFLDGVSKSWVVGAMCGCSGALSVLPFLPAMRRLPYGIFVITELGILAAWLIFLLCIAFVPVDLNAACYFNLTC